MKQSPAAEQTLWMTIARIVLVFLVLDVFLVSINLLGIFKSLGHEHFEATITQLATNPFLGLLVGILATSVFQSSSSTTSLIVGLVAADFLGMNIEDTLRTVIPIMMGANIGTSVTNMLVSLGHIRSRHEFRRAFGAATVHDMFNLLCVALFLPIQIATNFLGRAAWWMAGVFNDVGGLCFVSPLKYLIKPQVKWVIEQFENPILIRFTLMFVLAFLVLLLFRFFLGQFEKRRGLMFLNLGLASAFAVVAVASFSHADVVFTREISVIALAMFLLFSSLVVLVKNMKALMLGKVEVLIHRYVFKTAIRSLIMGWVFTVLVQSSSITTSLVVPLAGAGILNIHQIFPYTLGANVGTTVTAILAALSTGQISAVAVSFSHMLFNLLGVLIFYFKPMRMVPINISRWVSWYASKKNRFLAIAYIVLVFFGIPIFCLYFF